MLSRANSPACIMTLGYIYFGCAITGRTIKFLYANSWTCCSCTSDNRAAVRLARKKATTTLRSGGKPSHRSFIFIRFRGTDEAYGGSRSKPVYLYILRLDKASQLRLKKNPHKFGFTRPLNPSSRDNCLIYYCFFFLRSISPNLY